MGVQFVIDTPSEVRFFEQEAERMDAETDLDKNPANYQPLTPLTFLERCAKVYPDHPVIIHGTARTTYRQFYDRARQLGSALARRGIRTGDSVSVLLANSPAMLECH